MSLSEKQMREAGMSEVYIHGKLTMRWWAEHPQGGIFALTEIPPEVAAFGTWKGWFRIETQDNKLVVVVPRRL